MTTLDDLKCWPIPPGGDRGFALAHNRAIDQFLDKNDRPQERSASMTTGELESTVIEYRLLTLLSSIDLTVTKHFTDAYALPYLVDLVRGFRGLLNLPTGRLLPVKLDAWCADAMALLGRDPDQEH